MDGCDFGSKACPPKKTKVVMLLGIQFIRKPISTSEHFTASVIMITWCKLSEGFKRRLGSRNLELYVTDESFVIYLLKYK